MTLAEELAHRLGVIHRTPATGEVAIQNDTVRLSWGTRLLEVPNVHDLTFGSDPFAEQLDTIDVPDLLAAIWAEAGHLQELQTLTLWRLSIVAAHAAVVGLGTRLEAGDTSVTKAHAMAVRAQFHLATTRPRKTETQAAAAFKNSGRRQRAVSDWRNDARWAWARLLLQHADWPDAPPPGTTLSTWVDREIDWLGDSSVEPGADLGFDGWLGRELMSRRFMLYRLWQHVRHGTRWAVLAGGALAALITFVAWIPGLDAATRFSGLELFGWQWVTILGGAVAYFALMWGIVATDEAFSYPFALRFAAGSVIGTTAVTTLFPKWAETVRDSPAAAYGVAGILLSSAAGYIVVEARLHGLEGRAAFSRSALVLTVGLIHATLISTVAVALLAPVFVEAWPVDLDAAQEATTVHLFAAAAVTAAVYLQVLWDDRPVTYPLSALRFTRSR